MTIDLTSIANAVIALIAAIITAFVIPWIRSKTTAAQFEKIKMWVTVAVEAAEQIYTGSGRGAEKKAYVVEFLNSKGFKIDPAYSPENTLAVFSIAQLNCHFLYSPSGNLDRL